MRYPFKYQKRLRGRNRHHLKNVVNGGGYEERNLIYLDIERHEAWHKLFKNLDLDQAIALLIRLRRIKRRD